MDASATVALEPNVIVHLWCRSVQEGSPLGEHLHMADMITSVNGCPVRDGTQWLGCMAQLPGLREDSVEARAAADQLLEIMGQPVTKLGALSPDPFSLFGQVLLAPWHGVLRAYGC